MNTKFVIRNERGWYLLPQKSQSKISIHFPVKCVIRTWDTERVPEALEFDSITKALSFLHKEFTLFDIKHLGIYIHQEESHVYVPELIYVGV